MASVGFDNSVRLWDLSRMAVVSMIEDKVTLSDREGQINTISWMPDQDFVCIGTVTGLLKVIDIKRSKVVAKIDVCPLPIFEVDWNLNGIVACSENGTV
jgi:WD40 repeat protein